MKLGLRHTLLIAFNILCHPTSNSSFQCGNQLHEYADANRHMPKMLDLPKTLFDFNQQPEAIKIALYTTA